MEWYLIVLITVGAMAVVVLVTLALVLGRRKNTTLSKRADAIEIKDGVRYTKNKDIIDERGQGTITLNKGDIVLKLRQKRTVSKSGEILPGKYTILSANNSAPAFNIRIGGFVREYKHNTEIVLGEGDEISAVSHNVILR